MTRSLTVRGRERVRPATPKAEETRRRIFRAALDLFRSRGFDGTTMREIAEAAGAATGAAYYYFPSKEAIVMAFYLETQEEMQNLSRQPLAEIPDLEGRLRALLALKLEQFGPYRDLLGALFRHAADPASPLSPFGEQTRELREQSTEHFREALEGSDVRVPSDLAPQLPHLLWLYQMGLILYWIYDRSPGQARTRRLLERTVSLVVRAIKMARFPVLRPLRKAVVELLE